MNVVGKFKIELLEKFGFFEFSALRIKCYAFPCGDDSENKLKCVLNLKQKILNLKNITFVWMAKKMNISFKQSKWLEKYKNLLLKKEVRQ